MQQNAERNDHRGDFQAENQKSDAGIERVEPGRSAADGAQDVLDRPQFLHEALLSPKQPFIDLFVF